MLGKTSCLIGLVCACLLSCKESSQKSSHWEAETLKAATGAQMYKGYPLVARCTKTYKTNQVMGSDCIDFYGKIYLFSARSQCNLSESDLYTHDDKNLATTLELNLSCPHEGMQGGALFDAMGNGYTSDAEGITIFWYKSTNPSLQNMETVSKNWISP